MYHNESQPLKGHGDIHDEVMNSQTLQDTIILQQKKSWNIKLLWLEEGLNLGKGYFFSSNRNTMPLQSYLYLQFKNIHFVPQGILFRTAISLSYLNIDVM